MHSFSIFNLGDFSRLFVFSYQETVSSLSGWLVQGWMAYNQFSISYGFSMFFISVCPFLCISFGVALQEEAEEVRTALMMACLAACVVRDIHGM